MPAESTAEPAAGGPALRVAVQRRRPGSAVVTVAGELDLATAPLLDEILFADLAELVVVDLTAVTFLGVAGITVLLRHRDLACLRGAAFRLVAGTRPVLRPMRLLGLDSGFEIHPDAESALSPGPRRRC